MNLKKMINKVATFDYVSFDIFDTLIKRNVSEPTKVFSYVEKKYKDLYHDEVEQFSKNRILAERMARERYAHEITLDQIYEELNQFYASEKCEKLKKLEIQIELDFCQTNFFIYPLYEYCLTKKKKIVITSDMYLPEDVIRLILEKNGYTYDYLFVSNSYGCNKANGKLFLEVLKQLNIKASEIIHIGDSLKADYLGSQKANIAGIKISKRKHKNANYLECYCKNNAMVPTSLVEKVGFFQIGTILANFSLWLDKNLKECHFSKIFFLSREGKIFMDSFDHYYKNNYDIRYLNVSRRSLTFPLLHLQNFSCLEELLRYLTIKRNASVGDFFQYLNFFEEAKRDFKEIDFNKKVYHLNDNAHFFHHLWLFLKDKSFLEYQKLEKYFAQENVSGEFAIVDIGWNGTMQKCLNNLLQSMNVKHEIKGFYFYAKVQEKNMYSFVPTSYKKVCQAIENNIVFVENLFQNIEGSTIGYQMENNQYLPIKKKLEFDEDSVQILKELKKGIFAFHKNFKISYLFSIYNSPLESLAYFLNHPTYQQIKVFQSFVYSDTKKGKIIVKRKLTELLFHPRLIKSDLIQSGWKSAYLKSIFKIPLPYGKMVTIMRKLGGA
jgi:HAD superfamily hydrolase (TIGR01549 family)